MSVHILRCSTGGCDFTYTTPQDSVLGQPINEWWADRHRLCPQHLAATQQPTVVAPGQLMAEVTYKAAATDIQGRAEEFHAANPWVFEALEALTIDLVNKGARKVGIRMLWEIVRWQYNRGTVDPSSGFKVNDHYHSRYVRFLIAAHPEWADLFNTRGLRAA